MRLGKAFAGPDLLVEDRRGNQKLKTLFGPSIKDGAGPPEAGNFISDGEEGGLGNRMIGGRFSNLRHVMCNRWCQWNPGSMKRELDFRVRRCEKGWRERHD